MFDRLIGQFNKTGKLQKQE